MLANPASSPVAFKRRRGKREKIICSISHHALPGSDITATDLYKLHCTVSNELGL